VDGARFTRVVDVRYGECDQQGVVFNANYWAYVDDAMDHWMRSLPDSGWVGAWDVMLKTAVITWHGPARWTEQIAVDCGVSRFGSSSFDAVFELRVGRRPVADVVITYVSVAPDTQEPTPTPPDVVAALGPEVTRPASLPPR
jgi:acyl-CoA thioester hydrolase